MSKIWFDLEVEGKLMISERSQMDVKILKETLSEMGEIAAVEMLTPFDNRNYKVRFIGRGQTKDIFAKINDSQGDPESPLTRHRLALHQEHIGLNIFHSVSTLLEKILIPNPIQFKKIESRITNEYGEFDETQLLFLPYVNELSNDSPNTVIPHAVYSNMTELDAKTLEIVKTSAYSHYEFISEPIQKELYHNSGSEIRSMLDDQKTYLKRAISNDRILQNVLDFPYLKDDIQISFEVLYQKLIGVFGQKTALAEYWLQLRPLNDTETVYYENISQEFTKANKRVTVPGERAPWNESIFLNDRPPGSPICWQCDFEKWNEISVGRFLGENLAPLLSYKFPKLVNTYALSFLLAYATDGLRPISPPEIRERVMSGLEVLISAVHHASVYWLWHAAYQVQALDNVESASNALKQTRKLLANPLFFIEAAKQALKDPVCLEAFWEVRARAVLQFFADWDWNIAEEYEQHVKQTSKLFGR